MSDDLGRYQMLWDCPACGTTGLLGLDHRFCPACGAAQDPKLRYFPSDAQKVLVEDHPFHGADVVCPACDTPNAATAEFCTACGSPLDGAKSAATRSDRVLEEGASFAGESARDAKDEARQRHLDDEAARKARMAGRDPEDDNPKKKRGFLGVGLFGGCAIVIGILLFGCIGFWLLSWLWSSTDQVTVAGHRWEREIAVQVYGEQRESDWKDEVPSGATIVSCRQEKRSTKRVKDGEDCNVRKVDNGDGTFSEKRECTPTYREDPIMGEKCTFTVMKWKDARKEQAAGSDLNPKWPAVKLGQTGNCVGCEREGDRKETYTVVLKDSKGTEHTCSVSESRWRGMTVGQRKEATFGGLTGAIDCSSL